MSDYTHVMIAIDGCAGSVKVLARDMALAKRTRDLLKKEFPELPAEAVHFLRGKPASEIRRLAESLHGDLLVIGSHGQSAVKAAVLGSTANAVLHGIHCDVYTVRV